jgi:hypothetical protein
MKKYLLFLLVLICGTILFSCTNNEIISGDDLIIPEETSSVIDYKALGFILPFLTIDSTNADRQRTDGEIDPLHKESYLSEPQKNLSKQTIALKEKFFNSNDYALYGYDEGPINFFYYLDVSYVNNKFKVLFYNMRTDPLSYHIISPTPFIDGIVSNNETSYVFNSGYNGSTSLIQYEYYFIFSALYYDDTLPYRVYFSAEYIFLMSKEKNFSKTYLEKFTPENGVYLFKD